MSTWFLCHSGLPGWAISENIWAAWKSVSLRKYLVAKKQRRQKVQYHFKSCFSLYNKGNFVPVSIEVVSMSILDLITLMAPFQLGWPIVTSEIQFLPICLVYDNLLPVLGEIKCCSWQEKVLCFVWNQRLWSDCRSLRQHESVFMSLRTWSQDLCQEIEHNPSYLIC